MTSDSPRSSEDPRRHPPIDQVVELLVYAPLGFALGLRQDLPTYVARGRREVDQIQGWLGRRAHGATHESVAALRGLGLLPATPDTADDRHGDDDIHPGPPTLAVVADVPDPREDPPPARSPSSPTGPDADSLAIPGYESLSANQVVPRLVSLSPDELEAVRRYESAARGRKTILSRIAQLQAG